MLLRELRKILWLFVGFLDNCPAIKIDEQKPRYKIPSIIDKTSIKHKSKLTIFKIRLVKPCYFWHHRYQIRMTIISKHTLFIEKFITNIKQSPYWMESNDPNQQQLFPLSHIHLIFSAQTTPSHRRHEQGERHGRSSSLLNRSSLSQCASVVG